MITRETIKSIVRLTVALGTGQVVDGVITRNAGVPKNAPAKVVQKTTSFVVGGAIAQKTAPYADNAVDQVADCINEIKNALKK